MNTSTTLTLACTLVAGLTFAQDGEPRRPAGGAGADFIQRIDTNKDGKITKEEFLAFSTKEGEDRFSKIDANSDGTADEAEMKSAMERMSQRGGQRRPEGGSPGEGGFRRPPEGQGQGRPDGQGRPEGAPRDGERPRPEGAPRDGERPRPEGSPGAPGGPGGAPGGMRGMMGAMANPDEAFGKMDKNSDGNVDTAEYKEFANLELENRFKGLDQDANGSVSKEEFRGAMERMRGAMRGGMGGPGGPGGPGGMRRPEGAGGESGGFRRPPEQGKGEGRGRPEGDGAERPRGRPEADQPEVKKPEGV